MPYNREFYQFKQSILLVESWLALTLWVTFNFSGLLAAKLYSSVYCIMRKKSLQWCHNGRNGVSDHQPHHCLFNRLLRRRSKKTSTLPSLAFVRGSHRWPVNSPHKWPVTRKMFPFDDVIMLHQWLIFDRSRNILYAVIWSLQVWVVLVYGLWYPTGAVIYYLHAADFTKRIFVKIKHIIVISFHHQLV